MHRLAEGGIALVLLDDNGRFKARLEGAVNGNVLLRQAQFQRVADATTLDMARACVAGKIKNTRRVLQRGARTSRTTKPATLARLAERPGRQPTCPARNGQPGYSSRSTTAAPGAAGS